MNIRSARPKRWVVIVIAIAVVFICGLIAVGPAYAPVKYGTVALIARFGKLTGQILEPGLHWRIPFVDQVVVVPTVVISYETSDNPESSGADYRDYPVTAQTIDGQQINIKYTVLFRIPASQTANIVQNVGRPQEVVENVVKAHSRNLSRLWAQSHTAEDLYSGEGIFSYEDAVRNALQQEFDRYGVALDDFLVRKIDFGEEYINAIEQQQIAQEAIETARYQSEAAEYEKERQIRLAEAEAERTKLLAAAEAERTKLLAGADAERQRLLADAEAYGIEARGKALKQYPELTQWEFIRNLQNVEWGILPDTGITPLIPVPPSAGQAESPESP